MHAEDLRVPFLPSEGIRGHHLCVPFLREDGGGGEERECHALNLTCLRGVLLAVGAQRDLRETARAVLATARRLVR